MQDFIRQKNMENYRKLLAGSTLDEGMREYVSKLLFDEEKKDSPPLQAPDDG